MALPDGNIDVPDGLSFESPCRLRGWALFGSEFTAAVEVSVDGRELGRARLGLPRPDLAMVSDVDAAPVCGFEFWVGRADVAPDAEHVTLEAEVRGTHGSRLRLRPVTVPIRRSPRVNEAKHDVAREERDLARMRERTARAARRRPPPGEGIRLLAYSHRLERSGAPLYLLTLLRHLQAADVRCTVVSPEDGPLRPVFESLGIPVHVSHETPHSNAVSYESKLWWLTAWAAPLGFDVVHINAIDAFLGVDLANRLGVPAIWAIHESFPPDEWLAANEWSPEEYVRERLFSAFARASAVILATDTTREQLLSYGPPERMVTMPYGIDLERVDAYREGLDRLAERKRLGIPDAATLVLSVATIEPRKGQTSLVMAFSSVSEAQPHARLALVGETGLEWLEPFVAGLRDFIARTGLQSRVTVYPVTPDHYQWLAAADVLVLASDIESLPLIVLEGMAFELPMVTTAVFGVPDLVQDGHTGFLCQSSDVGSLTQALERVLALEPAELHRVARAGAQEVRRKHDIRDYAARYESLVRALADDPQTLPATAVSDHGRERAMIAAESPLA